MKRAVCAFAVATLICAATYQTTHATPIAPLTGIQAGSGNITLVIAPVHCHTAHARLWVVAARPVSLVSLWPGALGVLV
jgi:hypothetical protein